MTAASLLPLPRAVFYDAEGNPLAGGLVHTYVPSSTTPKASYQDANGAILNTNPIVLDTAGSCLLYGAGSYQLTVTDALGNAIPAYSGVSTQSLSGSFDTIASLRANNVAVSSSAVVYVAGYYAPADGGEGNFAYSPTGGADNGGTIIIDAFGNHWLRETGGGFWSTKWFGAKVDGTTDDTTAINGAETALNAAGGGVLYFPAGTSITTGLTKLSNTEWRGGGVGVSIIKLKASTTANAVVAGLNAYTYFGTDTLNGIDNWALYDLTIDGNRTGGCTSDGLGVYGWVFNIRYVEIKSCNGRGWHNEYGTPGVEAHQDTQSQASDMYVWDCETDGIYFGGPTDSAFRNLNVYWNLRYGIQLWGRGTVKATDCHVWSDAIGGRQAQIGWLLDSGINTLTACVGEGSTVVQLMLRSLSNTIISGEFFYNQASPNTVKGIQIGETVSSSPSGSNTIICRVDNCQGAAVSFNDDTGQNRIDVLGSNITAASTGYGGVPGANSRIRIYINNCLTAGTLNTEALALGISGLLTPAAGIAGTTTNDNAAAGCVGEYISSNVASGSAVALTTVTTANVTSISLTAGDWDVHGVVVFAAAGTTTVALLEAAIGTSSAVMPTLPGAGSMGLLTATFTTGGNNAVQAGMRRISLASTTTVYLLAQASFGTSTMGAYGFIGARRAR